MKLIKAWTNTKYLRLMHPHHFGVLARDIKNKPYPVHSWDIHLCETMEWLKRAQDVNANGGVAAGYSLLKGWDPSYVETTGYIGPTFFDYASQTNNAEFRRRAYEMMDWEIAMQLPSGAVVGGYPSSRSYDSKGTVFNTGQVIFGWVHAFRESGDEKYLLAARRAGDWLVKIQDPDGYWRRHTYLGRIFSYNVRTAWALLELHSITHKQTYLTAARKNLNWTIGTQNKNAWMPYNVTRDGAPASLHRISYAIRGTLECALHLDDERAFAAAKRMANALLDHLRDKNQLLGEYDETWKPVRHFRCLTGEAQLSLCFLRIYQRTGDSVYLSGAQRLLDSLKSLQAIDHPHPGIRGGIKGSHPTWGRYCPFRYPNWAAKFFADAVMLASELLFLRTPAGKDIRLQSTIE